METNVAVPLIGGKGGYGSYNNNTLLLLFIKNVRSEIMIAGKQLEGARE